MNKATLEIRTSETDGNYKGRRIIVRGHEVTVQCVDGNEYQKRFPSNEEAEGANRLVAIFPAEWKNLTARETPRVEACDMGLSCAHCKMPIDDNPTTPKYVSAQGVFCSSECINAANEPLNIPAFLRNQQNLMEEIADLRAKNASDREIAIAVGIPEDSPLLIK